MEPDWQGAWKCSTCKKINGKRAAFCDRCGASWQEGVPHSNAPKNDSWTYTDWSTWSNGWEEAPEEEWDSKSAKTSQRGKSPSASVYRNTRGKRSKGKKNKGQQGAKGQGKDKGTKSSESTSQQTPVQPPMTSWPVWEKSPVLPSTAAPSVPTVAAVSQHNADWIAAIKQDYPDRSAMPENLKAMVDKHEKTQAKSAVKSLHSATTALDKAQRQLADTLDAKQKHRASWIAHLTESLKVWEASLEDYRRHQAGLQDLVAKAREDIATARQDIERLNAQVGTQSNALATPAEEVPPEDQTDQDEERLRTALQGTLQACAGSLGIQAQVPLQEVQTIISDEEREAQPGKRPRSTEQPANSPAAPAS